MSVSALVNICKDEMSFWLQNNFMIVALTCYLLLALNCTLKVCAFPLFHRYTLTVWTGQNDKFTLQDLLPYRTEFDMRLVFYDLPDFLRSKLSMIGHHNTWKSTAQHRLSFLIPALMYKVQLQMFPMVHLLVTNVPVCSSTGSSSGVGIRVGFQLGLGTLLLR